MILKFDHAYHKLKHPIFTTLRRRWGETGRKLYESGDGLTVDVEVCGVIVGKATVVSCADTCPACGWPTDFIAYDTAHDGGHYEPPQDSDLLLVVLMWEGGVVPEGVA